MSTQAFVNRIATAVPENNVHEFFLRFAGSQLAPHPRRRAIFNRMADKSGIECRYSCFEPANDPEGASIDRAGIFKRGAFPGTATRMELFASRAPLLAERAVERVLEAENREQITHLIVTTCTGFSAPGMDLDIVARCGLPATVERTIIGFMGCHAAINALKQARHIVRSEPAARVLVVNIELCTLHLRESTDLQKLLSFCLWGDGCAAALVTARPFGLGLDRFHSIVAAEHRELMTWSIQDDGFDMVLSGQVPAAVHDALHAGIGDILGNKSVAAVALWAVHPGGRSVLDAVERALDIDAGALLHSREVLRANGNMSSATVMFVLERMLRKAGNDDLGCAIAFGPGLSTETMIFHRAGDVAAR